jgi:ribosomal-protein-alanine N-acetyltransferase
MISSVSIDDLEIFNKIGLLVNDNFDSLFNLEYIINSSGEEVFGYYVDNRLVAFVHVLKTFECLEIINIVVDEDFRKQGIASKLVDYIIDYYDDLEYILLEVNEHNDKAINLYNKLGFKVINVRKKYYGNDDALIMRKEVNI